MAVTLEVPVYLTEYYPNNLIWYPGTPGYIPYEYTYTLPLKG